MMRWQNRVDILAEAWTLGGGCLGLRRAVERGAGTLSRGVQAGPAPGAKRKLRRLAWVQLGLLLSLAVSTGCTTFYGKGIQYDIPHQYAAGSPEFMRNLGHLVEPGILPSNAVTTLLNGDQIFPAMLEAIRSAQRSVCLETYMYWSGEIGQQFSDALMERARAGVKVHVIIDWVGSRHLDFRLLEQMRAAGVQVERYNPLVWYALTRLNHRDHRKLLIVDGRVGFTGGAGIADQWKGNARNPSEWRDSMFKLEGPAVAQMQAAFMDNWIKTTGRVLDGDDYFPPLAPAGTCPVQVFKSSPREGTEDIRMMYLMCIAAARKHIRLAASYYVPDKLTTQEFLEARRRGVEVEIIVPGAKTDAPIVKHASRGRWGSLLKAGVRIYEYQPTMFHCKKMIVDEVFVSVGSANFGNRSFRLNDEANMNVYSREFALEQIRIFEEDKKRCRQVTYTDWKRRSLYKRFMEVVAAPFRSQL